MVAYTYDDKPVTAGDLKAVGAMAALLRDALKPNLVQTLEGTPAFVHGGPFANIAHGCNSVMATRMAMRMGDYTVTEAGFGADLGAEKFLDIKCRMAGLKPDAVVVVGTVRALKMHGGVDKKNLAAENLEALERGVPNLLRHVRNMREVYHLPCVVAINRFPTDTDAEIDFIIRKCRELGVNTVLSTVWAEGGKGGEALAREVVRLCEEEHGRETFTFSYDLEDTIENKLNTIAKRVYGGQGAVLTPAAAKQAEQLTALGYGNLPICVAKTQYSFSDDPDEAGRAGGFQHHRPEPEGFRRRRLPGGPDRRDPDHAGPAEVPRRRAHRRGRGRPHHRPVLSVPVLAGFVFLDSYFAYSVLRVSRMTLTRIWPGYSISFSMVLAISLASTLVPSSVTSSGLTMMRTSRPLWMA